MDTVVIDQTNEAHSSGFFNATFPPAPNLGITNASQVPRIILPYAVMFPITYRIIGTTLLSFIFIVGFLGNVMICVVVTRTKGLRTPTYCYLVSLAVADIILVSAAIPEQILSYHLYSKQWVLGHLGCSVLAFATFLAINAGSISILAFTVERYIAICHPMLAHMVCTVSRARRIITAIWSVVFLYSAPWLGLSVTKPLPLQDVQGLEKCDYRLSRDLYLTFFVFDAAVFYFLPLSISVILYARMGTVLYRSTRSNIGGVDRRSARNGDVRNGHSRKFLQPRNSWVNSSTESSHRTGMVTLEDCNASTSLLDSSKEAPNARKAVSSRVKVVKMLVIVVVFFAVLWLPYRGLLVYNSLGKKPWLNKWYVLFAKTLVYCNSAVNPFLYTVLSRKFRQAFFDIICGSASVRKKRSLERSGSALSEHDKLYREVYTYTPSEEVRTIQLNPVHSARPAATRPS